MNSDPEKWLVPLRDGGRNLGASLGEGPETDSMNVPPGTSLNITLLLHTVKCGE